VLRAQNRRPTKTDELAGSVIVSQHGQSSCPPFWTCPRSPRAPQAPRAPRESTTAGALPRARSLRYESDSPHAALQSRAALGGGQLILSVLQSGAGVVEEVSLEVMAVISPHHLIIQFLDGRLKAAFFWKSSRLPL
jgi:hypothetical protein